MRPTLPGSLDDLNKFNLSASEERFDASWQSILSPLVGIGRAAGADFVEFFLERGNVLRCSVENGKLTDVSPSLALGAGVRLHLNKKDCYVSTTDLSFSGLCRALEKGLAILGLEMPGQSVFIPEINFEPLRDYALQRNKNNWLTECAPLSDIADGLLNVAQTVTGQVKHLQSLKTNYFRDWQEVLVASSDGVFARDVRLTQSLASITLCADGAHRTSVAERFGTTGNPKFFEELNVTSFADELAQSAGNTLYADYVQAGARPIVMANDFGGVIFHEACGHLLETTQIERGTSPFTSMKGEKIANTAVTAWDEGVTPNAFGSIDMDDEGMPAQRTLLIENGILKNFIADRLGSLKTGHARTGSGRRQNFTYAAASRMRNTYIAPGKHSVDDLLASIDNGIYCKKMGGGSVGATGQFNFAVTEAYEVKGGKLGKALKGATLIGDATEILGKISMCANDLTLAPGFCGSISGSIYTTVGQPHIKVDSIMVGGR